ncbi:23S rRNA (pseudouridine(1915)-N(3))-methyltransferase RlmH [Helicobacter sp. 23-1044]
MKIKIYTISKKAHNCGDYEKMLKSFGVDLEVVNIMNAKILNAQKISVDSAKEAYGVEFSKYLTAESANFALDTKGKELDSAKFSEILQNCGAKQVNFFVGGAYGFTSAFLSKITNLSLSKLTFSHKIVPLILCEQIYRAFCIMNRHPYHK